jgi:hypothetical protein
MGFTLFATLLGATPARADHKDLDDKTRELIQTCVERGVNFLRSSQSRNGVWGHNGDDPNDEKNIGASCLVAIALLESEVPVTDPAVQGTLRLVRQHASRLSDTYTISLAIILLDRGPPGDGGTIASLVQKLASGQLPDGGWGYKCPATSRDIDNSNTQFAVLSLWVARRTTAAQSTAEACIKKAIKRFRATQNSSGGWGYVDGGLLGAPTLSMTCAGLLALGLDYGMKKRTSEAKLKSDEAGKTGPISGPPKKDIPEWEKDEQVMKAFSFVGNAITTFDSNMPHLTYTLWSLERVAMIFGKEKINNVDWYVAGVNLLSRIQKRNGSWAADHGSNVDTAFALLFLRRSNLTRLELKEAKLKTGSIAETIKNNPGGRAADSAQPKVPEGPKELTDREVRNLGEELTRASGPQLDEILKKLVESKNKNCTQAMIEALDNASVRPINRSLIREAVATRLSRMKPEVLQAYLREAYKEYRLAAAMASGKKGNRYVIPDLIPLLSDRDNEVAVAAHDALKTLSGGKDFGKNPDAWLKWYQSSGFGQSSSGGMK